jgi:hypothetical protein
VPKDKKDKKDKKQKKGKKRDGASRAAKTLQQLSQNPIVADVVAAALIGMASALKDSEKARRLASDAGDQLEKVSKASTKQGNAMWDLALDIGRRTLETLASETETRKKKGDGA